MKTATAETSTQNHPVVTPDRWIAERKKLLAREKELTRLRDEIARERRALPWERVEKNYVFETPDGPRSMADLFEGRSQLLVQHFMLGPGWEQGCKSCSFMADHADGMKIHLEHRDVTFVAVSRATLPEIERFHRRMGWQFNWVSSNGNDFNLDFHVSFTAEERKKGKGEVYYNYGVIDFPAEEAPGISLFYKNDAGEVFHTYSTFGRGVEVMMGTYNMLDLAPKGRDEEGDGMEWVRHHDRYDPAPVAKMGGSCCSQN